MKRKKARRRKPVHPGKILDEHYIQPLGLNGQLEAQSRPFRAELAELSVKCGKELAAPFRSGESPSLGKEFFNLEKLAEHLGITRNTLFKIRLGKARITPSLAVALAEAFDTTAELWLNLQQKYDLWIEENERRAHVIPILKNGSLLSKSRREGLVNKAVI